MNATAKSLSKLSFIISMLLAGVVSTAPIAAMDLGEQPTTVFTPVDYAIANASWDGNPFDLTAQAVFTHDGSGRTITRHLYYNGDSEWVLRFTPTHPGSWRFATVSDDPELHGLTGSVAAEADPDARGFLVAHGRRFAYQYGDADTLRATNYLVYMNQRGPSDSPNPGFGNGSVKNILESFGPGTDTRRAQYIQQALDNGGHAIFEGIYNEWFKNGTPKNSDLTAADMNPDLEVFAALERLVKETHAAGLGMHFHAWGDNAGSRRWVPAPTSRVGHEGGINGIADQRLQRYIADRLGPIPGWSMGYGFDLFEWTNQQQVSDWANYLHQRFDAYVHPLMARGLPLLGPDGTQASAPPTFVDSYASLIRGGQILQTDASRPLDDGGPDSYAETLENISRRDDRPIMYEERHGYQRYWGHRQTDWPTTSMDGTRRLLWWWSMAGGCGSIYGFYNNGSSASADGPYPNPEYLRTHKQFWQQRLHLDSEPAAQLVSESSGVYALRSDSTREVVFWGEDVSSIDLSKVGNIQSIVAVNAKEAYQALTVNPDDLINGVWQAPNGINSDWALWLQTGADSYQGLQGATVTGHGTTMSYRYYIPDDLAANERVPLILYLHSNGRQGTNNTSQVDWRVTRYVDPAWQAQQKAVVLAPQVPSGRWVDTNWQDGSYDFDSISITPAMSLTIELVDRFIAEQAIDPDRVYVLGTSMGGFGVWNIMMHRPDLFAAAIPVQGGADPTKAPMLAHIPVWSWHGDADTTIPVSASRDMTAAMRTAATDLGYGIDHIRYTEEPGAGHGWGAAQAFTPAVDAWWLGYRRGDINADPDNNPPVITAASVTNLTENSATLQVHVTDLDNDPLTISWAATSMPAGAEPVVGPGATPGVSFDSAGDYQFTVTVSDGRGGSDTATVSLTLDQIARAVLISP